MDEREHTVCFTGHRTISAEERERIISELDILLERSYRHGYTTYIAGGAIGFDMIAACRVIVMKRKHPDVRLILALPCRNQTDKWNNIEDLKLYKVILGFADDVFYISEMFERGCMHKRNRFMVDNSALCISYCKRSNGGSAYTQTYADEKGLGVINLAVSSRDDNQFYRYSLKNERNAL